MTCRPNDTCDNRVTCKLESPARDRLRDLRDEVQN